MLTTFLAWFWRKLVEFAWEVIGSLETWTSSAKRIGCEEVQTTFCGIAQSPSQDEGHMVSLMIPERRRKVIVKNCVMVLNALLLRPGRSVSVVGQT
jgi:hypothetical protein